MISLLKKYNRILDKRQKNRIVILFFIMLISTALEVLGVSLMLPLVQAIMQPDIIETNKKIAWVCGVLDLHSHRTFVIVCLLALILVFIFKDLFIIFEYYVQTRFVYNNRFATQQMMLHIFMNRPYEYYLNATSGEIMRTVNDDVCGVYNLLTTLLSMLSESLVSLGLIVTIFIIDPQMSCFVAVMMGIVMLVIAKVLKPVMRREGIVRQTNFAQNYNWLLQGVNGIKETKVCRKESFFEKMFKQSGDKCIRSEKIYTVASNVPRLLIEMVSVCSMLALIAAEIFFGRDIDTLIPTLGAFAMAAVKLMPSANRIVSAVNSGAYSMPSVDKLIENMDSLERDEIMCKGNSETKGDVDLNIDHDVSLNDITYHYPNAEVNVLEDACMEIPVGKSVGIVGTSGAGKTTAVDIMLGLLTPQKGTVTVDGVDVMDDYQGWLSHIGYIPQMIFMLDGSIRSNVAFGVEAESIDDDKVWHALEEAQLASFVRGLPEGLDTEIGEKGVRISGGQRQRIGIARALYEDPDLLLFDEATSALDNETEAAIMESINSLHGKKTMVIIAHRLQTIEGCDMVYRVKNKKIERER